MLNTNNNNNNLLLGDGVLKHSPSWLMYPRSHKKIAAWPQVFALHFYQQNQIKQVWKSLREVIFSDCPSKKLNKLPLGLKEVPRGCPITPWVVGIPHYWKLILFPLCLTLPLLPDVWWESPTTEACHFLPWSQQTRFVAHLSNTFKWGLFTEPFLLTYCTMI